MSDDLVRRLNARIGPSRTVTVSPGLYEDIRDAATALTEARAEIERLRSTTVGDWASQRENDALTIEKYEWKARALAAESELSTLRDMLVLCGELGGMGKDETPAAYLRRLIDEVASVESLRARVREVVGPFSKIDPFEVAFSKHGKIFRLDYNASLLDQLAFRHFRAARQLMEEVK